MEARKRSILVVLGALVTLGLVLFLLRLRPGEGSASPSGSGDGTAATPGAPDPGSRAGFASTSGRQERGAKEPSSPQEKKGVIAELGWGSGPSQLGRDRPQEGNPQASMSMAADVLGNLVVLDQVNGRLLRLDADGKQIGSFPITQQSPQDVTMARDGTLLVLDRLRDRSVAILDPDTGALRGELPVEGQGVAESGLITGTFVDGDSVYIEREHGALIRIGDTSGKVDLERPEIPGRPTRDGRSYVLAGIVDRQAGRVFINAVDRQTGQRRFTREYQLRFPVQSIILLDSDLAGTLYLGVIGELPSPTANAPLKLGVRVFCLAPLDGQVLGQTDLPANTMPEETFRDFAVLDEGGFLYRHITESGVTLIRESCRGA